MQDVVRINSLIDAAMKVCGGSDNKLASVMSTSRQVISNWRHGHKSPSIEAQAELAALGGCSVPIVVLMAMIENAEGQRKERLQGALREWHRSQDAVMAKTVPFNWDTSHITPETTAAIKADVEAQKPKEGALLPTNWRKKADGIKQRSKDVGNS